MCTIDGRETDGPKRLKGQHKFCTLERTGSPSSCKLYPYIKIISQNIIFGLFLYLALQLKYNWHHLCTQVNFIASIVNDHIDYWHCNKNAYKSILVAYCYIVI